ncbi:MAG TPA: hypothetical protein VLL82_07610 [Mycobacterium sp.]|nr:hypothetical protein [Mycobacterium sp.]
MRVTAGAILRKFASLPVLAHRPAGGWACYRRHCPSRWTWLLNLGFALIAMSVLTTWQHHFFDIPTGFAVGVLACQVFTMDSGARAGAAQPILPI